MRRQAQPLPVVDMFRADAQCQVETCIGLVLFYKRGGQGRCGGRAVQSVGLVLVVTWTVDSNPARDTGLCVSVSCFPV